MTTNGVFGRVSETSDKKGILPKAESESISRLVRSDSLQPHGLYVTRDCSLPGSSVHGILQARIPEWVAFSRGFPSSGDLPDPGIELRSPLQAKQPYFNFKR